MTFDDYSKFPEDGSQIWYEMYEELQDRINVSSLMLTDDIKTAARRLEQNEHTTISMHHSWAIQMYGAEVLNHMGRLAFGERDLMPLGLVKVLSNERFRWQAYLSKPGTASESSNSSVVERGPSGVEDL